MNFFDRLSAGLEAFRGPPRQPVSAPFIPGPTGDRTRSRLAKTEQPRKRRRMSPLAIDRGRWLRADIEKAEAVANSGQLQQAAQIADWCKSDLTVGGLMSTRCSVPRLPREWRGDDEARAWLQGEGQIPGCFDAIFPPGELEELSIDHLDLGAGVSCFVQPNNSPLPRLVRLDNQYLIYSPGEDRWKYQGYGKTYNIDPNNTDGPDGAPIRWVLHLNGEQDPWRRGIWAGLGYDQVSEDGAGLHRDGFIWRFGNPFVIAKAPAAMSEDQKLNFWGAVKQWTMGFAGVTPGHEVSLLQPKAEGREVFKDAEEKVERRAMMRIAGQVVTSTGGVGFANAEIFATIASFLVARTGQDLASTLNTQAIPIVLDWAVANGYISARRPLSLGYDTTPPQAREAEAKVIQAAMTAFVAQWDAAEKAGDPSMRPSVEEYKARYRLPVVADRIAAVHAALRALTDEERASVLRELVPANSNGAITVQDHPNTDPQSALNGAQISSAVDIVKSVANGEIPRESGISQLQILLNVTNAQALQIMGNAGAGFIPTIDGIPQAPIPTTAPMPTETRVAPKDIEEPEEPGYSEKLAASMTARNDATCPCDRHETRFCPRCRVIRRFEAPDDPSQPYRAVWHASVRRAAA